MTSMLNRRELLQLAGVASAGIAGVVFASRLPRPAAASAGPDDDFLFLQMSDTHWGFNGPAVNPDATITLAKAVAAVNALERQPDFIVFTGDLTHTTDDGHERRTRMAQFREIVGKLRAPQVRFMAGEHDAALDNGEAYREFFGDLHYTFDHKGVHFVVLDNVSDPAGAVGGTQLDWLRADLARVDKEAPVVVLTHRPLFDLYPDWDWATRDGAAVVDALMAHEYVTVFYGHIHQEHHHQTRHIAHHAAKGLMYPLPPPGSVPKKAPLPWDAAKPYNGSASAPCRGARAASPTRSPSGRSSTGEAMRHPSIATVALATFVIGALPFASSARSAPERVIHVTAKKFEYDPHEITLRKNVPVVLEITSLDRDHGFKLREFGVRADVKPGQVTRVRIVPDKVGVFPFQCDVFCGGGHEDMSGELVVVN
jgi:hypothetical protein